jgi:hypothetical protein
MFRRCTTTLRGLVRTTGAVLKANYNFLRVRHKTYGCNSHKSVILFGNYNFRRSSTSKIYKPALTK